MGWKLIPIDNPGAEDVYGGDDINKINKYLAGFDLLLDDPSDKVDINTDTTFGSEKFRLVSPTTGFKYIWRTQDITADRIVSMPLMEDDGEIQLSAVGAVNDWGDFLQTFRHQKIAFRNPANTFSYLLNMGTITADRNIILPTLAADDTLVFANATQTLTNKTLTSPTFSAMTFDVDSNTLKHSTTNNSGDLLVNDGSKFQRKGRGTANQVLVMNATGTDTTWIDQANLAVTGGGGGGGSTGDFSVPTVNSIITGAWYGTTVLGGAGVWANYLTDTSLNVTPIPIADSSGRMGLRWNFLVDDDRAGFRTNGHHFSRVNDPELWVRYKYDSLSATHTASTNYRVVIGFTDDVSADYSSDGNVANKSAFMWYKETAHTATGVIRNDGDATQDYDASAVSLTQTDTNVNTIRLFADSTNNRFGISLNGATAVYYNTEIPAANTKLGCIVQFENEGSDDRSFEIYGAYFRAKVI